MAGPVTNRYTEGPFVHEALLDHSLDELLPAISAFAGEPQTRANRCLSCSRVPTSNPFAKRSRALAGRGLRLINQLCDLVELRSGQRGTSMRMRVRAAA